jgi:hypothetical protein
MKKVFLIILTVICSGWAWAGEGLDATIQVNNWGFYAIVMVVLLGALVVFKGLSWDRDKKVLQIGSKKHPETLDKFNTLIDTVGALCTKVDGFEQLMADFKTQNEETQVALLKGTITDTQLPPQTRSDAYDMYKKHGNNSWVDNYYIHEVKPELEKVLELRLHGGEK